MLSRERESYGETRCGWQVQMRILFVTTAVADQNLQREREAKGKGPFPPLLFPNQTLLVQADDPKIRSGPSSEHLHIVEREDAHTPVYLALGPVGVDVLDDVDRVSSSETQFRVCLAVERVEGLRPLRPSSSSSGPTGRWRRNRATRRRCSASAIRECIASSSSNATRFITTTTAASITSSSSSSSSVGTGSSGMVAVIRGGTVAAVTAAVGWGGSGVRGRDGRR